VRALVERAGSLREKVAEEAADGHRRLGALADELEQADERLEDAADGAKESLGQVVERATEGTTQVSARLRALHERLDELDGLRARLQQGFDAAVSPAPASSKSWAASWIGRRPCSVNGSRV
jgi:uncharacterized membrane protein YccC